MSDPLGIAFMLRHSPTQRWSFLWSLVLVPWALAGPASSENGQETMEDFWYVVKIGDKSAGWMHRSVTRQDDRLRTQDETHMAIRRGAAEVTLHVTESFVETIDGTPLEATSTQRIGLTDMVQTMRFDGADLHVEHRQGSHVRTESHRIEEPWLPPAAVRRLVTRALATDTRQIAYATVLPTMGPRVTHVILAIKGSEPVEVFGKIVHCTAWAMTTSAMPEMTTHEFVDARGHLLKSTIQIAGMTLTFLRADEQLAKAQICPPELMATTLVDAGGPIAAAHRLTRAIYIVKIQAHSGTPTDRSRPVDTAAQSVTWEDDRTARITVDLQRKRNPSDTAPGEECRRPSAMIDSDAPGVLRLLDRIATEAQRQSLPPGELAEKLRVMVGRHIWKKDLSVGFATASEAAQSGQGDCSEHAVLLAALLRAADIPSRTVTGLVYADRFLGRPHVFVYHMWTQAWIEDAAGRGQWHDLDATRHAAPFDASHIALGTSALSDDNFYNDLLAMAPFIGTLHIEVVHVDDPVP